MTVMVNYFSWKLCPCGLQVMVCISSKPTGDFKHQMLKCTECCLPNLCLATKSTEVFLNCDLWVKAICSPLTLLNIEKVSHPILLVQGKSKNSNIKLWCLLYVCSLYTVVKLKTQKANHSKPRCLYWLLCARKHLSTLAVCRTSSHYVLQKLLKYVKPWGVCEAINV